jgi:D-alanine-D-alanine ligase-like ATP-grasp enzyme
MSGRFEARAVARMTDIVGVAGSRGRTVGSWLDLARSMGAGATARRLRGGRGGGVLDAEVRNAVYASIWRGAAAEVGAEVRDLGAGFLEVSRAGGPAAKLWQQVVPLDDPVTLRLALDKPVVHELLTKASVPVPEHVEWSFSDPGPALEFMSRAGGPTVVKAASGTGGGEGTTAGVDSPARLMRARLQAGRFGGRLLIERQVPGAVHRLLFLDGELIDVIRHVPPRLIGDGRSTVQELLGAENARRVQAAGAAGLSLLDVGLDTVFTLERQGLRLDSVVPAGTTIAVQTVTNDNRIEDTETITEPLDHELVEAARRAASAVGLRLAGVDVITPDISQPLERAGGVVAEVNGTPGIHHHYHVADAVKATPVAVPILEKVLQGLERANPPTERETVA